MTIGGAIAVFLWFVIITLLFKIQRQQERIRTLEMINDILTKSVNHSTQRSKDTYEAIKQNNERFDKLKSLYEELLAKKS